MDVVHGPPLARLKVTFPLNLLTLSFPVVTAARVNDVIAIRGHVYRN